jgi:vacuolar-type H+-ATPase subunit B/Vma2
MGFRMSDWDNKLLKYGVRFEREMMDLSVNIPLEEALDLGWRILADCFEPMETGMPSALIDTFWPESGADGSKPPVQGPDNTTHDGEDQAHQERAESTE